MKKLNTFVHAHEVTEDGGPGRSQQFGPGDKVPDWARKVITNPKVWEGDDEPGDEPEGDLFEPEPPRSGKGSGLDAWRSYADRIGVELEDGMTRDDVIAAVDLSKE
jgi:hypothetical protein